MRPLLVFLATLLPLVAILYHADRDAPPTKELPGQAPPALEPPVLTGADLAGPRAPAPFAARLRRLSNLEIQVIDLERSDFVQYYVRFGRLARHEGRPRLEEFFCAVFDPPESDQPKLRLTIESPVVEGDPVALLHDDEDLPRQVHLIGGVTVHDARGRTLARIDRLTVDLEGRTVSTDAPVILSDPDSGLHVRAAGLRADIDMREARLAGPVEASVRTADGTAKLSCRGEALLASQEDDEALKITFQQGARFEHPLLEGECDRIEALVRATTGSEEYELSWATLDGGFTLRLDPEVAGGLREVAGRRLRIVGEDRILVEGALHAERQGVVEALGLGERLIEIDAGAAELKLERDKEGKHRLRLIEFTGGFSATDSEGAGRLESRTLCYDAAKKLLVAGGGVEAAAAEGALAARELRLHDLGDGAFDIELTGPKRVEVVADGKLGPLGEKAARGKLVVESGGPLRMSQRGEDFRFHAGDGVDATLAGSSSLSCKELDVAVVDGELDTLDAVGSVDLVADAREARLGGDRLHYDARDGGRVTGEPAFVQLGKDRRVRARKLHWREDGRFEAVGEIDLRSPLDRAGVSGAWHVRCQKASGSIPQEGPPESLEATGGLVAIGPEDQRVEGERFVYDGKTGRATLEGSPARVRRGSGLLLAAPAFDLVIRDGGVAAAEARGPVEIDFRPGPDAAPAGWKGDGIHHWKIALKGTASFDGERVDIPEGAAVRAFDEKGILLVNGSASRVRILLERSKEGKFAPARIDGDGGVLVQGHGKTPAKVTARRLSYEPGSGRVEMLGRARVVAEGWSSEVTFERVVFVVGEDGVELKRASGVAVRETQD